MYDLFIGNKNYSSWSLRPWVLMRELNIPFRENWCRSGAEPDAFRDFSPTGKVPCLVDGDITVWDSLAITEYLGERHAGVWPAEVAARAWARSRQRRDAFGLLRAAQRLHDELRHARQAHAVDAALQRDLARLEELWADGIGRFGGPFLTGARFCAADAFFAPVAFRIQTYDPPIGAARAAMPRSCWHCRRCRTGTPRRCRKPGATRSTKPKRAPWANGAKTCARGS